MPEPEPAGGVPASRPHPESLVIGALLTALVAMGQISTALYLPSMPSLVGALGAAQWQVNLTFTPPPSGQVIKAELSFGLARVR